LRYFKTNLPPHQVLPTFKIFLNMFQKMGEWGEWGEWGERGE
jgi:hypothetical protein